MTEIKNRLKTFERALLLAALVGSAFSVLGYLTARQQFFISFLTGFVFWFGIAIGGVGLLLLHDLTGGAWGDLIKPQLEALSLTLPTVGLLFIPILFGLDALYPWARPDAVGHDPILLHKSSLMNVPFFCGRAVVYFLLWSLASLRFHRWSSRGETAKIKRGGAVGLIVFTFSTTFIVLDWMMSIEQHWTSTIYEVMVIVGWMLSALSFVAVGLWKLQRSNDVSEDEPKKPFVDMGNMLLAFVMIWAYIAFSQYLIIWSANLPDEISWYLDRQEGGWFWVAMLLVLFQFILPFLVLLGRNNKRRLSRLGGVASLVLALSFINTFWLIQPSFFPGHLHVHWLDLVSFGTIGSFWGASYLRRLNRLPGLIGHWKPEASA